MPSETDNINHINELSEISKKLKINENNILDFLHKILDKNQEVVKNEQSLKIIYFNIITELERMDQLKSRIDSSSNRRGTLILFILLLLLIGQTGLFYHLIFNVEDLGWDLIEPTTFLLGSSLFLFSVFSYVKLHKNAISGERIYQELRTGLKLKKYIRNNFNIQRYNDLKNQRIFVEKLLQKSKRI